MPFGGGSSEIRIKGRLSDSLLERDAALSGGQPPASWSAGQPSRELISELLVADHDLSKGVLPCAGCSC